MVHLVCLAVDQLKNETITPPPKTPPPKNTKKNPKKTKKTLNIKCLSHTQIQARYINGLAQNCSTV